MMTSMANRAPQLIASVALVLTAMSGCVSERDRGVEAETCVSWADLSDAQVAFDEADAVIIGRSSASTDVTSMFGLEAAVHDVEVLQVLKGDVVGTVAVASIPETCTTGAPYPNGDPLDAEEDLLLFLTKQDGETPWSTVTPFDGAQPAPKDGSLPFKVPATASSLAPLTAHRPVSVVRLYGGWEPLTIRW